MSDALTPMPLDMVGQNEEANTPLAPPGIVGDENYAKDDAVAAYIAQHVAPTIDYARQHRKMLEQEWREIRRITLLEHDNNQKYLGRSNAYLPLYIRSSKTLVSQVVRGLFPSDEYLDVMPRLPNMDPESGKPVKDYLQYEFEKCAKLRLQLKKHLKQYFDFGWSVVKAWYHKELESNKASKRSLRITNQQIFGETEKDTSIEGFRVSTRSIMYFYVWPTTIDELDEATLVFEDIDIPRWYIKEMMNKGKWENGQMALDAPYQPDHGFNVQQHQVETTSNTTTPTTTPNQTDLSDWRTIQEAWCRIPLPKEAYLPGENPEEPVMCQMFLVNGLTPLVVRRHPHWHNRYPYIVNRLHPSPGSFYSKGEGYTAKYLQYLANDTFNQVSDNLTYGMNPMAILNPNMIAGNLSNFRPGGIIQTTDINQGIKFDRPPSDQVQWGMQFGSVVSSMISDSTGTPPIMQGTNAGKGARTATSSQILQKNAMNPIQDIVEDLEADLMVPLMYMAHSLGQQYRSDDMWIQITGEMPVKFTPAQLIGDYNFRWLASNQAANQQQQAQQAIELLQILEPLIPIMQQFGKTINPEVLIKKIFNQGFGFRGYNQLVITLQEAMMLAQQNGAGMMPGMAPGGMPGQPPTGQPGPISANTQPGALPAQAGEGEDFSGVRQNSDQLSSMLGGMGGMF